MMTTSDRTTPLPPEKQRRSRELIAERLGWPPAALDASDKIEERFPEYYCWWTPSPSPGPGFAPAWGAALTGRISVEEQANVYGRTPEELTERIGAVIKGHRDA